MSFEDAQVPLPEVCLLDLHPSKPRSDGPLDLLAIGVSGTESVTEDVTPAMLLAGQGAHHAPIMRSPTTRRPCMSTRPCRARRRPHGRPGS